MSEARRLPLHVIPALGATLRCRATSSSLPVANPVHRRGAPAARRLLGFQASPSATALPPFGSSSKDSIEIPASRMHHFASNVRRCASRPSSHSTLSTPCAAVAAEPVPPQSGPPAPAEAAAAGPQQHPEGATLHFPSEVARQAPEPKKVRVEIILNERDIVEKFCRGSGKGGQKVNTTSNCVRLHHVPTGIRIRCHDSRSQFDNRRIARKMLIDKLDEHVNGELSKNAAIRRKKREEWLRRREEWLAAKLARETARQAAEQEGEEMEASLQELGLIGAAGVVSENVSTMDSPNHQEKVNRPSLVTPIEVIAPGELLPAGGVPGKVDNKEVLLRQAVAVCRKS